MRPWRSARILALLAASGAIVALGGCHSASPPPNPAGVLGKPETKAQQIQAIQSNPHIPAQAKAGIIKQLEHNGPPPGPKQK